jgi:hypothetical protein
MSVTGVRSQPLPELSALGAALASVFEGPVRILERRRHAYASSFPGEVIACEARGERRLVLCKYEAGRWFPQFGHRGGPGYEARVYREVVGHLSLPAPTCFGAYTDPETGDTWLFLEFLAEARRLAEELTPAALPVAARWAGRFHATDAAGSSGRCPESLRIYDGDYYAGWARRAAEIAGENHRGRPWLRPLCERAALLLSTMPELPSCVIHGEFTPNNLLLADEAVLPIDWETAAVGVGAIDLASLTDRWPADVVRECEAAYVEARWPGGAPADHERSLDLARLYWDLRWLGDRPEWLAQPRTQDRYRSLLATAERLGIA